MTPTSPRLPASSAQYGIWMGQQMVPDSPSYLTAEVIELRGALDRAALCASVTEVLNNCATLHMRFQMDETGLWQWPQTPAAAPYRPLPCREHHRPVGGGSVRRWVRRCWPCCCCWRGRWWQVVLRPVC